MPKNAVSHDYNKRFNNAIPHSLSKHQVKSFYEHGYIILEKLVTQEEIKKIKDYIEKGFIAATEIAEEFIVTNKPQEKLFRCPFDVGVNNFKTSEAASILAVQNEGRTTGIKLISWIGGVYDELVHIGRQSKITIPVGQLLGSDKADHLINQAHYKMPNDDITFDWHQDIQYRRSFDKNWQDVNKKGSFVQVLTAVDKVESNSGALEVIPGSHHIDLHLETVEAAKCEGIIKDAGYNIHDNVMPLLLNAGDTVFMHPKVLHQSGSNTSDHPREMFINGFSFPGANKKKYPGVGSAQEINLQISSGLLSETNDFVSNLLRGAVDSFSDVV